MATKLSKEVLNMKMDHNGVQIPVGLCIKLAESTANDIELYPYLISLLFFAQGRRLNDLFRECQRLKTLHGAAPFSLPISPTISDEDDVKPCFVDRVKDIINTAATKNGKSIETNARGHSRAYIFNLNANVFSDAIEELVQMYSYNLEAYLGGDLYNVNIGKVAPFIGQVIKMNLINSDDIQQTDILFAFEEFYKNKDTVRTKLSEKLDHAGNVVLGMLGGILKKKIKAAKDAKFKTT